MSLILSSPLSCPKLAKPFFLSIIPSGYSRLNTNLLLFSLSAPFSSSITNITNPPSNHLILPPFPPASINPPNPQFSCVPANNLIINNYQIVYCTCNQQLQKSQKFQSSNSKLIQGITPTPPSLEAAVGVSSAMLFSLAQLMKKRKRKKNGKKNKLLPTPCFIAPRTDLPKPAQPCRHRALYLAAVVPSPCITADKTAAAFFLPPSFSAPKSPKIQTRAGKKPEKNENKEGRNDKGRKKRERRTHRSNTKCCGQLGQN